MNNKDISVLLKKADELRALFVLGQRVIPFLEEIFLFVSEIQPLLDDMNISIEENLAKMPNASQQLSKVTEATELATNEIMDIVDGIVYKSDIINSNLERINTISEKKITNATKLLELLYKAIDQGSNLKQILPKLQTSINSLRTSHVEEQNKIVSETNEITQSISMDSGSIMMSLQVQDITSQQIAAVNNLLGTVQTKLKSILHQFQNSNMDDLIVNEDPGYDERINVSTMHREIAFDPIAVDSLIHKDVRQGQVDDLLREASEKGLESIENSEEKTFKTEPKSATPTKPVENAHEPASADDIDAMFNNVSDDEPAADAREPASADDIDAMFNNANASDEVEGGTDPASADDIDAMFNNVNTSEEIDGGDEPASADDIDALFNSTNESGEIEDGDQPASADDIDALFGN